MEKLPKLPHKTWVIICLFSGIALISSVSGCEKGASTPINLVMQVIGDLTPLPAKVEEKFQKFINAFKEKTAGDRDLEEHIKYFRFAFKRIRTSYVRQVQDSALIDAAIKGLQEADTKIHSNPRVLIESAIKEMTKSLDPHSSFLNAREYRETFIHTKGEFGGLGIEVTMQDGFVKVVAPIEDTPAERGNMMSGDLIVSVDGVSIKGLTLAAAVRLMRGPPGEPIELIVRREGRPDFMIKIIRAIIKVRAVRWHPIGNIAYIRVSRFSEKVKSGIVRAFADIRQQIGEEPQGIVLDLRNNPGGLLEQSVILADAFLDSGEIVSVRGRTSRQKSSFEAGDGDLALGEKMVVLVNGGSASASEIVISALKHQKRATIMGGRTFGKGSVQTIIPMPGEGALRLTTALYYGADGHTIQARGVNPDILIEPDFSGKKSNPKESDLPGAIPKELSSQVVNKAPRVLIEKCPKTSAPRRIGRKEAVDQILGCAIEFLKAGSKEEFLAVYGPKSKI